MIEAANSTASPSAGAGAVGLLLVSPPTGATPLSPVACRLSPIGAAPADVIGSTPGHRLGALFHGGGSAANGVVAAVNGGADVVDVTGGRSLLPPAPVMRRCNAPAPSVRGGAMVNLGDTRGSDWSSTSGSHGVG